MAAEAHAQLTNNPNDEIKHVFEQLFGRRIEDRGDAQLVEST
jgi:hypothetical protein